MEIKAVVFDFRDTLIDVKPSFAARNSEIVYFLEKEGHELSTKDITKNLDEALEITKGKLKGTPKVYDFDLLLRQFLKISNISLTKEQFKRLHARYFKAFYENINLYGDAKDTLDFLYRLGYKMGLVIDGNPEIERIIIKKFGLGRYFKSIIISEEIGYGKVSSIPLKVCIEELEIEPKKILVVGDRFDKDIRPANQLGALSARLVRKGGRYSSQPPKSKAEKPKFTIHKLSDIKKLLGP